MPTTRFPCLRESVSPDTIFVFEGKRKPGHCFCFISIFTCCIACEPAMLSCKCVQERRVHPQADISHWCCCCCPSYQSPSRISPVVCLVLTWMRVVLRNCHKSGLQHFGQMCRVWLLVGMHIKSAPRSGTLSVSILIIDCILCHQSSVNLLRILFESFVTPFVSLRDFD